MILFNSFLLLFVAFALWRKRRLAIALIGVIGYWLVASGWIVAPLIALAQSGVHPVEHPVMTGRTAIILLGAGTRRHGDGPLVPPADGFARIARTAELYSACKHTASACTVIVSGGDPQHHGATEADIYARYLLARGVANDDLIRENRSRTTYENAKFTTSILRSRHDDALILVTSSYQMRRALLDFARFGCAPQPVFANRRDAERGWLPRQRNVANGELALHEIGGVVQFYVYRMLGWF